MELLDLDPDPNFEYGSGSRSAKKAKKFQKKPVLRIRIRDPVPFGPLDPE